MHVTSLSGVSVILQLRGSHLLLLLMLVEHRLRRRERVRQRHGAHADGRRRDGQAQRSVCLHVHLTQPLNALRFHV